MKSKKYYKISTYEETENEGGILCYTEDSKILISYNYYVYPYIGDLKYRSVWKMEDFNNNNIWKVEEISKEEMFLEVL